MRRIFFNIIITVEFPYPSQFERKLNEFDRKILIDRLLQAVVVIYSGYSIFGPFSMHGRKLSYLLRLSLSMSRVL